VQRQARVRAHGAEFLQPRILGGAAVAAEDVPPHAAAQLGLEGGQPQALAVAVQAHALREADREAVEHPDAFALAVELHGGEVERHCGEEGEGGFVEDLGFG
jgi:hypothetical protein